MKIANFLCMRVMVLFLLLALPACSSAASADDRDARADDGARGDVVDANGGTETCCPIEDPPSGCGCWAAGGSRRKGCGSICDGDSRSYAIEIDEDGCRVLSIGYGYCGGRDPYGDTGTDTHLPSEDDADAVAADTADAALDSEAPDGAPE